MSRRLAAATSLAALLASSARADCAFTQSCYGHGTNTHRFGSSSECEGKLAETRRWNDGVGGGCDFTACSCSGSTSGAGTGSGGLPWGSNPGQAMAMALTQTAVAAFAADFGKWLSTSQVEEGNRRREAERLAALVLQRLTSLESDCRRREGEARFKTEKADLTNQLRPAGVPSSGLAFRDLSASAQGTREQDPGRTARLERLRGDPARIAWCRSNIPSCPAKPVDPAQAAGYEGTLSGYARQMAVWEAACEDMGAPASASAPAPASPSLRFRAAAPPAVASSKCADHFPDYEAREEERRQVLSRLEAGLAVGSVDKLLLDWCKEKRPLCPLQGLATSHGRDYLELMASYDARKADWDGRCVPGPLPVPPPTGSQPVVPSTGTPRTPAPPVPYASDCSACNSERVRAYADCDTRHEASGDRSVCHTRAFGAWVKCQCALPVRLRPSSQTPPL